MKKILFALCAAMLMGLSAFAADGTQEIRLIQDDAQVHLVTKVYSIKNLTRASEILGFVKAAVIRYYKKSNVRALNASPKDQFLIVTTADKFIPYVDQIISVLDRGTKSDKFGSKVKDSGFKWKVYYPKYRPASELMVAADTVLTGVGNSYAENNTLWVKDDSDSVEYAMDWVRYFDRPVPQVKFTFRYYLVRDSTLRDIGIDYLSWKNGPGMNLLDLAFSNGKFSWDRALNTMNMLFNSASWSTFGCFTAPAFDMSFVRLLQQSGSAKVAATADITMVNAQEQASLSLAPTYSALVKNPETHASSVSTVALTDFQINVYLPTICFFTEKGDLNEYGWIPSTEEFYSRNKGSVIFSYDMFSSDSVEANNYGVQIGSSLSTTCSHKTINLGREQMLSYGCREYDVEQTTGIPFLCNLPVLKYIFGTTTTIQEKDYMFVTVEANLVHPEAPAPSVADAKKSTQKPKK